MRLLFCYRVVLLPVVLGVSLYGCSTNAQRIDKLAASAGLQSRLVAGDPHTLVVYEKTSTNPASRLYVYLEGDGSPWGSTGMQTAEDPTARNPLALRLMMQLPGPAIYVARPCYQLRDAACSIDDWTSGRYSGQIVASMTSAIAHETATLNATDVVMVGYSGGGPLAVLIAERLPRVAAVITIGANLDIAAWAQHHHYLPLVHSLNPALSELAHAWPEVHISGGMDTVVPVTTSQAYFKRFPAAHQMTIAEADHACCWETQWPALLEQALKALQ